LIRTGVSKSDQARGERKMEIIIGIGIFITVVLLIEGAYFASRAVKKSEQKRVKQKLRTLSSGSYKNEEIDIVRKKLLSEVPWFNRMLLSSPRIHKLDRLVEQANTRRPVGFHLLLSMLLATCGYLAGSLMSVNFIIIFFLAVTLGGMPFFFVYLKKISRMQKFGRQLPDALDLIVRALKAGHAFSSGIRMVADEFDDPVGTEFAKTMDEINFGVGVPEALINLSKRVDCPDIKFFVVSVIIQRETGGNLAEVLENISYLIRERFKLQGRIRVLAAEGKFSAIVLVALPFVVCLMLLLVNPGFLKPLYTDPAGKVMIAAAIIMMSMGIFVMKKMISIKV
jgi:tight adherence protein B